MHFNPIGLKDEEVRTALVQIAQAIALQAYSMTVQAEQQGFSRDNPPASTMANRLKDFTRIEHRVYIGSNIAEDLKEECRTAMLHDIMDIYSLMVHVQHVEKK